MTFQVFFTFLTGIAAAPLSGRSGAIQAVVNLELPSATLQYANIIAGKRTGDIIIMSVCVSTACKFTQ